MDDDTRHELYKAAKTAEFFGDLAFARRCREAINQDLPNLDWEVQALLQEIEP